MRRIAGPNCVAAGIEKLPLIALAAASSVVTYVAQQQKGAMTLLGDEITLPVRMANALVSYAGYLGNTLWPCPLIVLYPYVPARPLWQPAAAALLLIAATGVAIWLWRSRPYLAVGWFWFLGTLVPVIGLIQVGAQSMADRYTYLPLVGIFILIVWAGADLLGGRRCGRSLLGVLATAVILACMILTTRQVAGLDRHDFALRVTHLQSRPTTPWPTKTSATCYCSRTATRRPSPICAKLFALIRTAAPWPR